MINGIYVVMSLVFAGICYWWGYNHGQMNGYYTGKYAGREQAKTDLLYEMYGVEQ